MSAFPVVVHGLFLLLFVFLPPTACEFLDAEREAVLQDDRVGHARVDCPLLGRGVVRQELPRGVATVA